MADRDTQFVKNSQALAKHAFGVMRLYCVEYKLTKEHLVDALATLCVELRDTYPDGKQAFDSIAAEAQTRYSETK